MYYDAVVEECGKDLWFSLWSAYTVNGQADSSWPTLLQITNKNVSFRCEWKAVWMQYMAHAIIAVCCVETPCCSLVYIRSLIIAVCMAFPHNLAYMYTLCCLSCRSVDDTDVDFMLSHQENTVLLEQGAACRRINVVVDVMRQYNGWGRGLALPAKQWGGRMLDAWHQGAQGAQAMGCWAEAAVWPDSGGELDNATAAIVAGQDTYSWSGWWNRYRILMPPLARPQSGKHGVPEYLGPVDEDFVYR
jgi:hypothetical protein